MHDDLSQRSSEPEIDSKPAPNHNRPWTFKERVYLEFYWGLYSLERLARDLGRTTWGIAEQAVKLKLGPFSKNHLSINEFSRISGFSNTKIMRTARHLGMQLARVRLSTPMQPRKKRRYALTEKQQQRLLEVMLAREYIYEDLPGNARTTQGRWGVGKKPERCVKCGQNEKSHYAKGMCRICYNAGFKKKTEREGPRYLTKLDDAQQAEAKALYAKGEKLAELCARYGVGRTTMVRVLRGVAPGYNRSKLSPEQIEEMRKQRAKGRSVRELAKTFGLHYTRVHRLVRDVEMEPNEHREGTT